MKYQYSPSKEYIAIHNPTTNDLKIYKLSNTECTLSNSFSLSSSILSSQTSQVNELHWMGDTTMLVWIETTVMVFDLSIGKEVSSINREEKILALKSKESSIYLFTGGCKKGRLVCHVYSKQGKLVSKVKLGKFSILKNYSISNIKDNTVLLIHGTEMKICDLSDGKSTKIELTTVLDNDVVESHFCNDRIVLRTQNGLVAYNITKKQVEGRTSLDTEGETLQSAIYTNDYVLLFYKTKIFLYTSNTLKLKTTFTMQNQEEQSLLGGCITHQQLNFCFYERNVDQVRSERIRFLDGEDGFVVPSEVSIGEIGDSKKEDMDTKSVKQPDVVSLSQVGPKRSPELSIPTPKRAKLNDDNDNDGEGLTLHEILQNQLKQKQEEYIQKQTHQKSKVLTTPSTQSLSTILTQILSSNDEQTFHQTIINSTTPTKAIMKQTLQELEPKLLSVFLNKLTAQVQTNHNVMGSVLPWVGEIIMFASAYRDELEKEVRMGLKEELLVWRDLAERRVRFYDDFVGLGNRLDFMIGVSRYRNEH